MLRASAETSPIHFAPAYTARNNVKKRIGLTIRNNVKCVGMAYSGIFIPIIGFSAKGPWRGRAVELLFQDEVFSEQPRVDLAWSRHFRDT